MNQIEKCKIHQTQNQCFIIKFFNYFTISDKKYKKEEEEEE
jgi:hypothetical protein